MPIIFEQVTNRRQLRRFVEFPNQLYQQNLFYVPALISDEMKTLGPENPVHEVADSRYFLARKGSQIVGRIACIIHREEIKEEKNRRLRFGWLDFVDDPEVSSGLLKRAEEWAKEENLEFVEGPVGFSNLDKAGMLTSGFRELSTMVTWYNHPYYPEHLHKAGFSPFKKWIEFEFMVPQEIPERLIRLKETVAARFGLKLVRFRSKAELKDYIEPVFKVLTEAYSKLPSYVPLTWEQKQFYGIQFLNFLDPAYICCVADSKDNLIGFGVTTPSLAKALQKSGGSLFPLGWYYLLKGMKNTDRAELLLIGVHPEWQNKGVHALIFPEIISTFISKGIKKVESNPELEENHSVQQLWKHFESRQHKTRVTFRKEIK